MSMIPYAEKTAIYALLGRIFIAELDKQSIKALEEPQIAAVFEKLQDGFILYLESQSWDDEQVELLASEYCHLFILPQKTSLSLRAEHWMASQGGSDLSQLDSIIQSVGFDASVINADFTNLPSDHLGVLLYFMSAVYGSEDKEIQALGIPLIQQALLPWIFRFNQNLLNSTKNPVYLASSKLLLQLIEAESSSA